MGRTYLREIRDYVRAKVGIRIRCEHCGHSAVMPAASLQSALIRSNRKDSFYEARRALRCSRCGENGSRSIRIRLATEYPGRPKNEEASDQKAHNAALRMLTKNRG